ncbi:MAG: hypothetical protein J6L72_08255 [Butyricicoccus sp.]|nr:hypothetical protein [Butyricicoccus sp.]
MPIPYQLYSNYLFAKAGGQGIPLSGTFELTARCNLDCRMCYIHMRPCCGANAPQPTGWRSRGTARRRAPCCSC